MYRTVAFIICIALIVSCSENEKDTTTTAVVVRRAVDNGVVRKGRIYEKEKVVDIPLSAIENNLKGSIKDVHYQNFVFQSGKKVLIDSGHNSYDSNGSLTAQHAWRGDGRVKWECRYDYTQAGKPKRWIVARPPRLPDTTLFTYNGAGKCVRSVVNPGRNAIVRDFVYDGHGNMQEEREFAGRGRGRLRSITRSAYDRSDNQILLADLLPDGTPYITRQATYDGAGNLNSLTLFVGDSIKSTTHMKNDSRGKHIELEVRSGDGQPISRSIFSYDDAGNMTSRVNYDGGDKVTENCKYEYQYDARGNILSVTVKRAVNSTYVPLSHTTYQYGYYN